jgi:choline dehydrogenase
MPRITTGNTMAPSVVIGEREADLIRAAHGLSAQSQPVGVCV